MHGGVGGGEVAEVARLRVELAVADGRLEWRSRPQIERIGRLNVVVAVDHHRGSTRRTKPFGVHNRMPGGRNDLGLEPQICKLTIDKFGSPLQMRLTGGISTHRWNAEKIFELFNKSIGVLFEVLDDLIVHRKGSIPLRFRQVSFR